MDDVRAVDDRKQGEVPGVTKGLRIATRCATVEQFVETYHQICEDSAIFIPNTQRPTKTVMQFRFDLQDGNPALQGVGTVVEELTTKHNRFDHVGIVVALQRLSPASTITFEQMLVARARAKLDAPTPVYPRAMTVPIEVVGASKSERITTKPSHQPLRQIPIPSPTVPSSIARTTRTKAVIGVPTLAKKPTDTVRIPAIIAPKQVAIPPPITVQPAAPLEPRMSAVLTPPSSIDDGWDSIPSEAEPEPAPNARSDARPVVATVATAQVATVATVHVATAEPTAATAAACIVEDPPDASDEVVTAVADIDVASAPVDQELVVSLEDHASAGTPTVTAVNRLVAYAAEPDPFDTVTAVEGPDGFLLALMRRNDGRAAPVSIEAVAPSPRVTLAISEPMQPIVEPAMEHAFAPPKIAPATFPAIDAPFATIDAPIAMPAIDHADLAGAPFEPTRRPRRWLAAAGAFAVLLCVTAATTVFVDRPAASVPPSTFVPAHESPLDSSAVATARDQAPPGAADPKKSPARAIAPPAVTKSKAPPRPAIRPLGRPTGPKKCRDLGCL